MHAFALDSGTGGNLTFTASWTNASNKKRALSRTVHVDGTQIPTSMLKSALISRYQTLQPTGTSNLFTGIAWNESKYKQFVQFPWHQINGCWPNQSYDGGSHIGITQVPTTMNEAYDWGANVVGGVNLFSTDKMNAAVAWENTQRSSHPQLRALSTAERERDALVFWGPYAGTVYGQRLGAYWVPNAAGTDWVKNSRQNPHATAWVDMVESLVGVN